MVCLEEIAAIANILKTAPALKLQFLHKIVNDEPYSKSSRKEFKKFTGFPQNYDVEARKDKILKDLTVCTILCLNCAGSAKQLGERITENLSDLASLKNNFTEQLMEDENGDSTPFLQESVNDVNKQPISPPFYHSPSPKEVFAPFLQTERLQKGNEDNAFLLKDLFQTMRSIDNENKHTNVKQYDFPTSNKNDMCFDNKFQNKGKFYAPVNKSNERIRCYNCGLFNHTSNECYHKNKGLRCFNCNQFGYKNSQCVLNKPDVKNEVVNEIVHEVVNESNSSSEKRNTAKINGYVFDALIDTGSTITLIRESVYQIHGRLTLNPTKIKLTSFSKSEIKPFGSFKSTIDIEDNKFMTDIYVIDNSQTTIDVII
ncbi:hypothetical protein TNCV_250031 [Trichonephila clavipes]|nr:hypothetical protein TNCV_250031 [Trichonephila clavipes]